MDIPQELVCNLCENLIEKAVVLPCCAGSVCLDCGQRSLGKKSACPLGDCLSESVYPDELIPNRRLRQKASDLRDKILIPTENDVDTKKNDNIEYEDPVVESTTSDDQKISHILNNPSLVESTTHDDEDSNNPLDDYIGDQVKASPSDSSQAPEETLQLKDSEKGDSTQEIYSLCKPANDLSEKEVEKKPSDGNVEEPSSENVPDEIKTTYGDHSVSIPSEYLNVAKEDPLSAFQKLMEAKDKQKGITNSTQYYGVPPNTLYPDYANPYSPYHAQTLYPIPPYFPDPYGGSYGLSNYGAQYQDKGHSYSQREGRKYSSYSERRSSEKRHSRYEKNNDHYHHRSQGRSSSRRNGKEHHRRKRNRSSSRAKSNDRTLRKSKKSDRKSTSRDEIKTHHKKENSKTHHRSSSHHSSKETRRHEQENESKHRKESLKKKKDSSSDDSSSSESSSSSSSSSSDEDSSSSSSGSSSKRRSRKSTSKKKKLDPKKKKPEEGRALDKIIEEHSKNVNTLVDKKKKKSKHRKSSI